MAKYVAEGIDVLVVSCTGGEAGDILNPAVKDLNGLSIGQKRAKEMNEAARILGIKHRWLGFQDSGMPEDGILAEDCFAALPLDVVTKPLTEIIVEFQPHVVTTYDENGGYPHPDHIRTHEVTVQAIADAAERGVEVSKLYFHHTFSRSRTLAFHEEMLNECGESPFVERLANWDVADDKFLRVTTRVECESYFPIRDSALKAHETQVDPAGQWFAVPRHLERRVWPTEDYELVWSKVGVELPESDLFAGLR